MKEFTIRGSSKQPTFSLGENSGIKTTFFLICMIMWLLPFTTAAQNGAPDMTVQEKFDLPDPARCTSNDLDIISADLDLETCDCDEAGPTIEAGLTLGVRNNTESLRTSFAFWAALTVTDPKDVNDPNDDTKTYYLVEGCEAEILPGSMYGPGTNNPDNPPRTKLANFEEYFRIYIWNGSSYQLMIERDENGNPVLDEDQLVIPIEEIPYDCGTSLELTNIYQAWTDASTNESRQCPLDPTKINPKCGIIPVLAVGVGLSASASTTDVSCYGESDGSIEITFSGGEAPYYLDSGDGNGFSSTPIDLTDEQGEPLDPPYKVTISNLSGSASGIEYTWRIKDSSKEPCIQDDTVQILEPDALSLSILGTSISCYGSSDGYLSLNPNADPENSAFTQYDLYKVDGDPDSLAEILDGSGDDDLVTSDITETDGVFAPALGEGKYLILGSKASPYQTGVDCYALSNAVEIQ
ncbi:SprB repeat-containing protein, partial [Salinimicrobium catena]